MQVSEWKRAEVGSMVAVANRMARKYGQIGILEPEDVAQNALLKALKKNDGKPVTAGWLCRVVRCAAGDAGRDAARQVRPIWFDRDDERIQAVCECADEHGSFHTGGTYVAKQPGTEIDLMPRIRKMLAMLSMPLRQVLVLHAEGYSYQEIALLTKTNAGTVRSRLFYARRRAKHLLADLL